MSWGERLGYVVAHLAIALGWTLILLSVGRLLWLAVRTGTL